MSGTSRPAWLGIELRHLAALAAVAREGSFRGAAESLGYVQSAVSQQLAHLEAVVGVRLVERRRGAAGVALTAPGELLLDHFEDVVRRLRAAQADIEALDAGRAGKLRVGVTETVAVRLMPTILRTLARRLPGVRVEMDESRSANRLAERVEGGALDLALGDAPTRPGTFHQREIVRDPRVLIVPADWPQATADAPLAPEDLTDMPLIAPASASAAEEIDRLLRARGVVPRYVLRSDAAAVVQAHVAAGIGAAIVPQLMVDESDPRTAVVELDESLPKRPIVLYWQRDRHPSPAMDTFAEVAVATAVEQVTGAPLHALAA